MLLRILGPIGVHAAGHEVDLGGPKQRLVLALLALRANRAVTVDELIDGLWDGDVPGRPRKTLQVYVAHLRSRLDGPGRIVSEPFGYRLVLADDEFDLRRFERLVADARSAAGADPDRAEGRYREALRWWPGRALADLRAFPAVDRLLRPLDNLRAEVAEEQLALRVRGGRPADAVTGLLRLTEAEPLRERSWALLMEAYYRSGRQSEALATFQRVRALLAEELGVDPGPELRRMERSVLRQDPGLVVSASGSSAVAVDDERRPATFVSAELAGYGRLADDLDPEDLMATVEAFRAEAGRIVDKHGGAVHAVDGGRVLAYFGYPVAAEDDPQRAVRAGLALASDASGPLQGISVGVHTGVALFRSGVRGTTVFGNAPVVAMRLQLGAGPGEVKVSAAMAGMIDARFRSKACPDDTYAVVDEAIDAATTVGHGRLRGRDGTLAEIRQAVSGRTGPMVVFLWGEAGIGKTALMAQSLEELGGRQAADATVVLRGDRHRRDQALHPVAAALATRYRDAGRLTRQLSLIGLLPGETAALGHIVGWAAPAGLPPLTNAARRRAVVAWLNACADGRPVRLVVEDLHDVDEETLELLEEFVDEMSDGVILLTSRTNDLPSRLATVACRVRLARLRENDARALALDTAGTRRLHTATVNEIVRRCDGHPLYLRELTLATVATASPTGGTPAEVPTSLRASLLARLDKLGPAKALAQRCAAVGAPFDRALAALLCVDRLTDGAGPALLDQELAQLVEAGVLRRTENHGEEFYTYSHRLLEDCAYASLSRPVRAELHLRIAESTGPSSLSSEPGRWAHHLALAGDLTSAAGLFVEAAKRAVESAGFFESSGYLRRALTLVPQLPVGGERDRLELTASFFLAGSLLMMNFIDDEVHRLAARARDLAVALGRADFIYATDVVLISALRGLGRYEEATQRGSQALSALPPEGTADLAAGLRRFHTVTLILTGQLADAAALCDPESAMIDPRKESIVSPLGPIVDTNTACLELALTALAAFTEGRPGRCERLFDRARRIAREAGAADAACYTNLSESITRQLIGDAPGTHRLAESSLEAAIELGRDNFVIWSQVMLGWAVSVGGNPREGVAMIGEALDHTTGSRSLLPYLHAVAAAAELAANRPAEALSRALSAVDLSERTGERLLLPYIHLVTADSLAATRSPEAEVANRRRLAYGLADRQGQRWFTRSAAEVEVRTSVSAIF